MENLFNIIVQRNNLTFFQKQVLKKLIDAFVDLQPHQLRDFSHFYTEVDEDLFLYRKSPKGLINIIIHNEDSFAFSYIDSQKKENDRLDFHKNNEEIDFEKIALEFFVD